MNKKLLVPILLIASLSSYGSSTLASDGFAGALLGAGTGAVLGNLAGGRDGAVVGGMIGAFVGAVAADDNDRDRLVRAPHQAYRVPPAPTVIQVAPRMGYAQPVILVTRPPMLSYYDRNPRQDYRRDKRSEHDRDWHDDHADRYPGYGQRRDW